MKVELEKVSAENTHSLLQAELYRKILPKIPRRIFRWSIAFFIIAICGGHYLMATEQSTNTAQKAIDDFLKLSAQNKITHLEVYYLGWNIATRISVTEEFLRDNHYDYKVIAIKPDLSAFQAALQEFKFDLIEGHSFDFRWGCVVYAENKEILRLFFPNAPWVAINGTGYLASPELIRSLLPFLPVKATKEMEEVIVHQWAELNHNWVKLQTKSKE